MRRPPYPTGHADQDHAGNDTLVLARMGLMDEQLGHRPGPVFIRFPLGSFFGAWLGANGVVARLIARDRTGHAGAASTSLLQGALVPMTMHWARAREPGPEFALGMPKENVPSLFECGDGRWIHVMRSPDATPLMQQELESLGDERIAALDAAEPSTGINPHTGANRVAFKRHSSERWLEELWTHDVPVQPAAPLGEIYFDEQAIVNDYVIDVEDPTLGRTRQPGHPYTTEPPPRVQGPAPRLGADTAEILANPQPARGRREPSGPAEAAPLAGVRVVDFGNFLAGPLAPMFMADLGADVIKIEATGGDPMRRAARVFDGCQRGKRASPWISRTRAPGRPSSASSPARTSFTTTCGCRPRAASASTTRRSRRSTPTSSTATSPPTGRAAHDLTGPASISSSRPRAAGSTRVPERATRPCGTASA